MPRILVLSASAGAGHNRAAEAVAESARAFSPGVEVAWVDSLKYTNKLFAKAYEQSYVWLASYAPNLWGVMYERMGENVERRKFKKAMELYDRLTYRKLSGHVEEFRPDAVVCTHFLPSNVLLAKRVPVPVYVVVTDYDVHTMWVHRKAAGYFVGCEEVKVKLARYGYPAEKIHVTGIPIHPVFAADATPAPAPADRPRLLFMSGGFGMGHMEEAVERILELRVPFRLTVVAGKNEKMRRKLAALAGDRAEVHGFVTNVHELMSRSDLIITKAGGLTVSECLARRLPMVIFSPIPGQEECNADYLIEQGAAVKARSLDILDYKVLQLLENPARLDMMKRAAGAIARPFAGRDVLRRVLDEDSARR